MKVAVITVSDRASRGEYADESGPEVIRILAEKLPEAEISGEVVPDQQPAILAAFARAAGADWIVTTGGTGPAARDLTPEATRAWIDRELPGLAEYLRAESRKETPFAVFSRATAGLRGRQYLVNFPGSVNAARFCAALIAPLMAHGIRMAAGEGH